MLLVIGGAVLTAGDIVLKKWTIVNRWSLYTLGMVLYLIGLNFLVASFKYKNIAAASVLLVVVNVVTLLAVSWFYFKEKISVMQLVGITLALIAVVILEWEH